MKVKIVTDPPMRINGKNVSFLPERGSEHAAGYDVRAREITIEDDGLVKVKLGIRLHCPKHAVYLIPRSGLSNHGWVLANSIGLIDEDYTGELQMRFRPINWQPSKLMSTSKVLRKMSLPDFPYKIGDRVGQIVLHKVIPMQFENVKSLEETKRGAGGFGHTGK